MAALSTPALIAPARAFDFFGLFGSEDEPPAPSAEALSYKLEFSGLDDDKALAQNLKDASNGWRLRKESPLSGAALAQRVIADYPRIGEALWGAGYFNAQVTAEIAGVEVFPDGRGADAAANAAERLRDKAAVPVTFKIDPGPLFHLRNLVVYDARTMAPIDPELFSKKAFQRPPDEPARAAGVRAMEAEWIDELRAKSYPLAKIVKTAPVILHREEAMDVAVTLDPGPRAGIGEVALKNTSGVPPEVIRSFIYLEEGEDYSPKKLADTRKSVARIEAIGSVKVEDGEALDKNGNLPIFVTTGDRKQFAVGFTGQVSTTDGPGMRAYWVDRNVFGEGERLRFDLQGGLAPIGGSPSFFSLPKFETSDLVGSARMSFIKPALWGSRNDLLVDAAIVRERTPYYWADYTNGSIGIRHRFSDTTSIQGGVEIEAGRHSTLGDRTPTLCSACRWPPLTTAPTARLRRQKAYTQTSLSNPISRPSTTAWAWSSRRARFRPITPWTTTPGTYSRAGSRLARSSARTSRTFPRAIASSRAAADPSGAIFIVLSLPTTASAFP